MTILSSRFENALTYATRLHDGQTRKDTATPYIAHLMAVASLVLEQGGTEDQAIAALLHDAIEDQGHKVTLEEIRQRFGETVAQIVDACTDARSFPKPPWRERKEAFVAYLMDAPAAVRLVACADKLHNARTILDHYRKVGEALWERFTGGRAGTLWYYRALVEAFRATDAPPLVQELDRVVSEIERLALAAENGAPPQDAA